MFLDNQAIFSDAQELTASAPSTNVLDMGKMGLVAYSSKAGAKKSLQRRKGVGMEVPFMCQVVEDFAGDVTEVEFVLQQSPREDFGADVTSVITLTVPVADLKAGYQLPIDKLPRSITERFVRMQYNLDDAATAGAVSAGIVGAVDGGYRG